MRDECLPFTSENVLEEKFYSKNRKICNIALTISDNDVTKKYFNLNSIPVKTQERHLSFENLKLQNITCPETEKDAITLGYLKKNVSLKDEDINLINNRLINIKTFNFGDAISLREVLDLLYISYVRNLNGRSKSGMTCKDLYISLMKTNM